MTPPSRAVAGGVALLALLAVGCIPATRTPMPTYELVRPEGPPRCRVVLLPGRFDRGADFGDRGFANAAFREAPAVEVIAADAHLGYYRDRSVVQRLHEDVVGGPAGRRPEDGETWLAGISMGGLGALLYTRDHPEQVGGLLLVAPFLGDEAMAAELAAAGSLASWSPDPALASEFPQEIWVYLKQLLADPAAPPLYLALGEADETAATARFLARELPEERVFTVPGGHDWPTWEELWRRFLAGGVLDHCVDPLPAR